ncbi:hypothetical protein ACOMHN_057955 [Nucella lapillus]
MSSLGFIPWDNPDNIISQETEQIVDTAVGTVCLPILFVISVPCNILNMLVFWTQGLKERVNLCLFCLSLVDFLHMLNNFLFNFERIRFPFAPSTEFGPVMEFIVNNFLLGFVRGFNAVSEFISMLIASERCLCVASPLRSKTMLKTRTTAVILLVATIFILTGMLLTGMGRSLTNESIPEGCMVLDMSFLGFIPWDNPDNIISQETEQIVDTAVGTVCLPILFVISVPCNIFNMLVFWTQGLKERLSPHAN